MINLNFWNKVNFDGPISKPELGPCWMWLGGSVSPDGYGQFVFRVEGKCKCLRSHRFAYKEFFKELPPELDHLCKTKICCNPWHLDDVTHKVNVHRCDSPAGINARKVLCKRGHELTGIRKSRPGHRYCKVCNVWYNSIKKLEGG